MHRDRIVRSVACGVAIAVASGAMADLLEFEFTGFVNNTPLLPPDISGGDFFVGHFSYDNNLQLCCNQGGDTGVDTVGILGFDISFFSAVTNTLISSFNAGPMDGDDNDLFQVVEGDLVDQLVLSDSDADMLYTIELRDDDGTAWDSPVPPLSLNLDDFEMAFITFQFLGTGLPGVFDGDDWNAAGEFTSLVLVPLPPAVWLGSLGILGVIVMRRKLF